jgi:NitT/TauT family transport system substrate-binding protein
MMGRLSRRTLLATALAAPHIARAADTLSVRLDFFPWGLHAGMHLANANGWFKEAGLAVDVQDGRGSGNTLQLVNAGQVDVGQIQVGLLPQAAANGARLTAFAGFVRATDLAVIVGQDSGINGVADFKGKSIVIFGASPWAPFIDLWLKAGGLSRDTVNMMFVDPSALFGTYGAGRCDGLMSIVSSALPFGQKARPSKAIMASEAGIRMPSYGLVATEATLKSKKAALTRLVQVQQRVWAWLRDGHIDDGVAAVLSQRPDARVDADVTREQIRLTLPLFDTPASLGKPIGWQTDADWQGGIDSLTAAGAIKAGATPGDFYTNEIIA